MTEDEADSSVPGAPPATFEFLVHTLFTQALMALGRIPNPITKQTMKNVATARHFIDTLAPQLGVEPIEVSDDEMRYLQQYGWPGNVRELRNLIERSLIVGALNVSALYQSLARPAAEPAVVAAGHAALEGPTDLHTLEKRHILAVLETVDGDKTRAAQLLGISRRTLERRCAEWALA